MPTERCHPHPGKIVIHAQDLRILKSLGFDEYPGNMSRKQERPKDFGSTDTEMSASGDQTFDRWMGRL